MPMFEVELTVMTPLCAKVTVEADDELSAATTAQALVAQNEVHWRGVSNDIDPQYAVVSVERLDGDITDGGVPAVGSR